MRKIDDLHAILEESSLVKLLATSVGEEKARECTERLLARYGSLATVFSEHVDDIASVGGINKNAALLIKLVAYVNSRRVTDGFRFGVAHSEEEICEYLSTLSRYKVCATRINILNSPTSPFFIIIENKP